MKIKIKLRKHKQKLIENKKIKREKKFTSIRIKS